MASYSYVKMSINLQTNKTTSKSCRPLIYYWDVINRCAAVNSCGLDWRALSQEPNESRKRTFIVAVLQCKYQ